MTQNELGLNYRVSEKTSSTEVPRSEVISL